MEDRSISYDTGKKVEDDSLDFKFEESFEEEEILDLVDIAEKGDEPQDQVPEEAVLTSGEEAVDDITISEDDLVIDSDELSLNLEDDATENIDAEIETVLEGLDDSSGTNEAVEQENIDEPQDQVPEEAVLTSGEEAVDDITISEDDLVIDSDELSLNIEGDATENIDAEIETPIRGLDESSGTNEAVEQEKVELGGLSGEKVEDLIKKTVEDVVERVVRETMVTVSEKVIKEAIDALRQTLESFEDRG